ncbi:MAG: hypothetical protein AAFN70_04850, partial [Planctomycetota bacterium]
LVIATDEAGYGPTLGPLVVAATVWKCHGDIDAAMQRVQRPIQRPDGSTLQITDSKAVYQSGKHSTTGLHNLHTLFRASLRRVSTSRDANDSQIQSSLSLRDALLRMAPANLAGDLTSWVEMPWYAAVGSTSFALPDGQRSSNQSNGDAGWMAMDDAIEKRLNHENARLCDAKLSILHAAAFNHQCARWGNKASVLTQTTLQMVADLIQSFTESSTQASSHKIGNGVPPGIGKIQVRCDRHGGRKRYLPMILDAFPDCDAYKILEEQSADSRYEIQDSGRSIEFRFTVGGDRFAPCGLASILAKYTRERLMLLLNEYFAEEWNRKHHRAGQTDSTQKLKPTAGYPVDANRFLAEIQGLIRSLKIDPSTLVRCR